MKVRTTSIEGLLILEPHVFQDERGWVMESFNESRFNDALSAHGQEKVHFVQDNESFSHRGVLRGLHYQMHPHAQGKLVRVIHGLVWDVAVDIRPDSPTRGEWFGLELSADNFLQLWIPAGFAHGFLTLSDRAQLQYKVTACYSVAHQRSLLWSDANICIDWPLQKAGRAFPILNSKDAIAPCMA